MTNLATGFFVVLPISSLALWGLYAIFHRMFRFVDPKRPPDYWPAHVRDALKRHY